MLKFTGFREKLKNGFFPVLVLTGGDVWLKNKCVSYLEESLTASGSFPEKTSFEEHYDIDDVAIACLTDSLFGGVRLITAYDYVLPQGKRGENAKKKLNALCSDTDKSFVLVFYADDFKTFEGIKGVERVDCERLDAESVASWIISYAKRSNVALDKLTAVKIASYCLCDMSRVESEIQKLIDYGGAITAEKVELLVHKDTEFLIFDFSKAIADKNASKSLSIYSFLIQRGEEARSMFAFVYNFYRRMYYVRSSAYDGKAIAAFLGVKESALYYTREVAEKYKPMQLKRALEYLQQADVKLKSFQNEDDVMKLLIMQLLAL